jgi:hypothetical protein
MCGFPRRSRATASASGHGAEHAKHAPARRVGASQLQQRGGRAPEIPPSRTRRTSSRTSAPGPAQPPRLTGRLGKRVGRFDASRRKMTRKVSEFGRRAVGKSSWAERDSSKTVRTTGRSSAASADRRARPLGVRRDDDVRLTDANRAGAHSMACAGSSKLWWGQRGRVIARVITTSVRQSGRRQRGRSARRGRFGRVDASRAGHGFAPSRADPRRN